ncbi:MAG: putative glycoside hydrolase [Myxococcales bacterium]|nr:putative glycoside hydrolase [Myxococcales bacterium]
MMPRMRRALLVILVVSACGKTNSNSPDAAPDSPDPYQDAAADAPALPAFRNPVTLPDDQLALQALQILGANVQGAAQECNSCHGMTRQHLRYWRALSDTSMSNCLTDLSVSSEQSARTMLDCMRSIPTNPASDYQVQKLGVFATAAKLPWFGYTFWRAYGDSGAAKLAEFQSMVAMPRGTVPELSQGQFDIVAEWFARGLPQLDTTLPADPAPDTCTPGVSADVAAHVTAMHTTGWRAVNRDNLMAMFDCGTATDPRQCLADKPFGSVQAYGTGWDVTGRGRLRVLKDVTYQSSYWTRSSPDGRFVAHGVANVPGSYVIDLQRDATIPISTQYDPAFFPDNSGFVFQGGTRNVCAESVLTSNPASITMTEAGCAKISNIGLYQHVGRGLNNGDFFAIDSQFVSDDGGHTATLQDPDASFDSHGYVDFTPMIFDGTKYVQHTHAQVAQPFEGDSSLSPSALLEMTRVSDPNNAQIGYVLHKVIATQVGSGYTIQTPEIARYCLSGGKPGFSYDERWAAYHHYVTGADAQELGFTGPNDPAFAAYLTQGAANIYLLELATGVTKRVTNMRPGQYALFPHFRSDGWIYADIRDTVAGHEYIVATDAGLILEQ